MFTSVRLAETIDSVSCTRSVAKSNRQKRRRLVTGRHGGRGAVVRSLSSMRLQTTSHEWRRKTSSGSIRSDLRLRKQASVRLSAEKRQRSAGVDSTHSIRIRRWREDLLPKTLPSGLCYARIVVKNTKRRRTAVRQIQRKRVSFFSKIKRALNSKKRRKNGHKVRPVRTQVAAGRVGDAQC